MFALAACSSPEPGYVSPNAGEPLAPHMIRLDPDALNPAQARKDAQLALYRGDRHLLGTGEMNPASVPGAPDNWREAEWRFGVRTIEDTRDATRDSAHSEFRDEAVRYATAYNRVIFEASPTPPQTSSHLRSPG